MGDGVVLSWEKMSGELSGKPLGLIIQKRPISYDRQVSDNTPETLGFLLGKCCDLAHHPLLEAGWCQRWDVWHGRRPALDEVVLAAELLV